MQKNQIHAPKQSIVSIQKNIPLHTKNWFKTGGSAAFYAEPTNPFEFQQALEFAQSHSLDLFILGSGANILISDEGFNGLVIHPQLKQIEIQDLNENECLVTAGSGIECADLIDFCLEHNISGLEEFSGIPGTIGGAAYINIHYYEFLLSHFLVAAKLIEKNTGNILTVTNDWFHFGYDDSKLFKKEHFLLSATFKLKKISDLETSFAQGRKKEIIRHRNRRYPTSGTCGSFFRNFHPHEVFLEKDNKKMIYVAYYLDKVGIKGALSYGGASVSWQHANMIVNTGNATSTDIIELAQIMQKKVQKEFGIIPQPECQLIGFKTYPLIRNSSI